MEHRWQPAEEATMHHRSAFGTTLRDWRARRRLSQLDLALEADISARHLAFLETGRAKPSRNMVDQLIEALEVPVRSRNEFLLTAGFAPQFTEFELDDAALTPLRNGLDRLLERHAPYPGLLLDRHWNVVKANRTATLMLEMLSPGSSELNVLSRLTESPRTAEVIENWPSLAAEFIARLRAEVVRSGDTEMAQRLEAFRQSVLAVTDTADQSPESDPFLCMRMRLPNGARLALFSAIGQFSAARDITAADLRIELFFPADAATEHILQTL
jgi:transcriptional regulator with XRE-family HTH domain